ncbi:MAG: helix-turn-helix transcriptional regulator [Lachnospiraceae bacterium]|nr:helix-turn-helix transcriptional regulator [Lachnospiraceae bacterium]
MMKYRKLFLELEKHNLRPSALVRLDVLSAPTLERLKKDQNVSLFTLDLLCRYLGCSLSDIASTDDSLQ